VIKHEKPKDYETGQKSVTYSANKNFLMADHILTTFLIL